MYWFREMNYLGFIPWLLTAISWVLGGWLIVIHAFNLPGQQRFFVGASLGLVSYLWLVNLIGHWFIADVAYLLPGIIILTLGLFMAWRNKKPIFNWSDIHVWPWMILFLGLFVYSIFMERGLAIFDDYHHLPAISIMGAGNLPPRYYLNANYEFSYHYGFEILGASLMRLGNMFAWSAFDISKALVWSLSLVIIALIMNNFIKNYWKTIIGVFTFIFMGGTRFLLMILPQSWLYLLDHQIRFEGVSQDLGVPLSKAIYQPLIIGGGPPHPYQFGFINGINGNYILSHGGELPLALIIIGLIWLLTTNSINWKSIPFYFVLFAHLALTYESSYGLVILSLALVWLINKFVLRSRESSSINFVVIAAIISIPFAFLQGGTLFSIVQRIMPGSNYGQPAVIIHSAAETVFSLNWPPRIFSSHLGSLSIFSPGQLFIALIEIGPIIIFTPIITTWALKKWRADGWMIGVIILSTWLGFILSMFLSYNLSERDITRFSKHAIIFWMVMLIIIILDRTSGIKRCYKIAAPVLIAIMCIGGVVSGITQLSAISSPVLSDGIDGLDSQISSAIWGKLNQDDLVFDPSLDWRATTLTGILTVASIYRDTTPEWKELSANPSLQGFIDGGYRYLYVDEMWWRFLSDEEKTSLSNSCIQIAAETQHEETYQFRCLLDFKDCITGS